MTTIPLKLLAFATLALAIPTVGGCAGDTKHAQAGRYRTVATQPGRETDQARRENRIGVEHLAAGDLDKAAAAFKRALTADVEFGPAHNNLGKIYFQQEDWYRAAWEFEYAAKLLPESPEPHNNLGLVLERSGELDRAVDEYRAALSHDPDNVEYLANLTRALIRRGDRTEQVRQLLETLIERETRPKWLDWARRQQHMTEQHLR